MNSRGVSKSFDQAVIAGVGFLTHGLEATSSIDMSDRGKNLLLFVTDVYHKEHEPGRVVVGGFGQYKILSCLFSENGGCERAERFSKFDFHIHDIFHVRSAWIGEGATVSECAR